MPKLPAGELRLCRAHKNDAVGELSGKGEHPRLAGGDEDRHARAAGCDADLPPSNSCGASLRKRANAFDRAAHIVDLDLEAKRKYRGIARPDPKHAASTAHFGKGSRRASRHGDVAGERIWKTPPPPNGLGGLGPKRHREPPGPGLRVGNKQP